jgi:purine-binding chemotaxis protein CheW
MAEPAQALADSPGATRRFLTFRSDGVLYALPAEAVSEIIRIPPVARVPQGPPSLLGIANLRGVVLPLASLRGLLGKQEAGVTAASRAVVLRGAAPVALAVDVVAALVSVDADRVETRQAELAAAEGERLSGAFQAQASGEVAKVLDVGVLLDAAFVPRAQPRRASGPAMVRDQTRTVAAGDHRQKLVTFEVAGQEYGLDLAVVQEIVRAPDCVAVVPRAEAVVIGVMSYRDTLLPLMSLRGLLGFGPDAADDELRKVVVTTVNGVLVGLVADRMRAIVSVEPERLEPTPPMLAARTGGEAKVRAIYRGEDGRRLISVLAAELLFREDVMRRLGGGQGAAELGAAEADTEQREALRFLIFRLGEDEFSLPIETIDEVARVPEQITRLPKTPEFVEGVVNLRGDVLPVIDQRRRFDMPKLEGAAGQRLVVVRTERHRAGLIVDSVSEVLIAYSDQIDPAPDLTGQATQLVSGVLNLESTGRIVLLLDPAELLTRAERGLLETFEAEVKKADL